MNSFVKERAMILVDEKIYLKKEKKWLKDMISAVKNKKIVYLFAEENNKIIGSTEIKLYEGRQNHIGEFGIAIRNGYRRIGLGKYLTNEIIKLSKKKFKRKIKIIKLMVDSVNKPAQKLYLKCGFKKVARIPKQVQYKGKLIDEFIMLKYL